MKGMIRISGNFIKMSHGANEPTMPKINPEIRKQELNLSKSTIQELKIGIRCRQKDRMTILEVRQKEGVKTVPDHTVSGINMTTFKQKANPLGD